MAKRPPRKGTKVTYTNTLVVDGNALFKVGYHGAKDEYNRNGNHIGGIYQFITVVRKLLNENLYHRVFVFWDGNFSGKLRYEIYEDYKSDRGKDFINGTRPNDIDQLKERRIVQAFLEDLFIRQITNEHIVEGDDFIAYYCKNKKPNDKVTVVTNDRDLCQLLTEDVQIYLVDLKSYVTHYNYMQYAEDGEKKVNIFNFHKDNWVLVKTICGDSSDSIRGVKGVKEKSLLKFFPEFGERSVTLREILNRAEELQEERRNQKKKPLKALTNIIEGISSTKPDENGKSEEIKLGMKLYERNKSLVDLSTPLMTKPAKEKIKLLMEGTLDPEGRGIKEAYAKMKAFGIDSKVGSTSIEYLMPFKKLMEREKKEFINENK